MKSNELIELGYLSTLEIIGEGAFDLLQGQITSDMDKVTDHQICLGALCNIKGRVESSFIVMTSYIKRVTLALRGLLLKYSSWSTIA